jgi:predicted  nucleic acid-binding Zn-ribbon protein
MRAPPMPPMSDESRAPVEVDQIECAPLGRAKIALRVTGRWNSRRRLPDPRAFLAIEAEGRRHRFAAMPEPRRPRIGRQGAWAATFALPAWLEPHLGENMILWLGSTEVPLPGPSYVPELPDVPLDAQTAEIDEAPNGNGADSETAAVESPPALAPALTADPPSGPAPEQGPIRTGGGADELQAMVDALRAELRERGATEAQLRGALAGAKAELEGQASHQTALRATQSELRDQLGELLGLVEREGAQRTEVESRAVALAGEVAELEGRVAELTSARDQVAQEAGELRAELERATGEALQLRYEVVQLGSVAEQEAAERILLEARIGELSERFAPLRAELAESEVAREGALGEAAGLRDELERMGDELARARGANDVDSGLSEAQSLLDEARAVTARLRGDS